MLGHANAEDTRLLEGSRVVLKLLEMHRDCQSHHRHIILYHFKSFTISSDAPNTHTLPKGLSLDQLMSPWQLFLFKNWCHFTAHGHLHVWVNFPWQVFNYDNLHLPCASLSLTYCLVQKLHAGQIFHIFNFYSPIELPYFPVYKSNLCISRPPFCSQKSASFRVSVYKSTSIFCKIKLPKILSLLQKIAKEINKITNNLLSRWGGSSHWFAKVLVIYLDSPPLIEGNILYNPCGLLRFLLAFTQILHH